MPDTGSPCTLCGREKIYAKLLEAEEDVNHNDLLEATEVFSEMRAKYGY